MFQHTWKVLGCAALMAIGSLAQAQSRIEARRVEKEEQQQGGQRVEVEVQRQRAGGQQARLSDYWLGLECFPVDAVLRSHLSLGEAEGLVVEQVVPDSPAAKAELKQHDVLMKAGGKAIKTVADLVGAVDEAKETELTFEIIRAGKPMTIKATPAKRPENVLRRVPDQRMDELRQWLERMQGEQPGSSRYRILGPGAVVLPGSRDLPKGMSVTITRSGGEPGKIIVKKDDQAWEISDKELDKLPDDVRPHVERMLGRGAAIALPAVPAPPGVPALPGRPPENAPLRWFHRPAAQGNDGSARQAPPADGGVAAEHAQGIEARGR